SPFSFTHLPSPALYTLSLHDALPIWDGCHVHHVGETHLGQDPELPANRLLEQFQLRPFARREEGLFELIGQADGGLAELTLLDQDRKSTRLNSSHVKISYAVFCLKKK